MSMFAGYFKFQNMTGQKITKGSCGHWTTDWGRSDIDLSGLEAGGMSEAKDFTTSSSNRDRWTFDITLADGKSYRCQEHACGFESEDNGGTVILQVIVKGDSHSFHMIMPRSNSCSSSF